MARGPRSYCQHSTDFPFFKGAAKCAVCVLFPPSFPLLLLTALPAPPSAYILARQLGGNESLMANTITVQTLAAFFVIPIWIELADRYL